MPALWQPGMSLDDNAMDAVAMATDVKEEQEEDVDVTQYVQMRCFFFVAKVSYNV